MSLKIIQTLWMAPARSSQDYTHGKIGLAMGWRQTFYNAASWTLSCLLWKKWYGDVHLYTDQAGHDFLIDTLRLPYTSVEIILDHLPYAPELWIMGKVQVYGMQEEPFLHTDGDSFPFAPLPAEVTQAPLIAQHQERVTYYADLYETIRDRLVYEPKAFTDLHDILTEGPAYNNGIIGGSHTDFFMRYAAEVREFIDRNVLQLEPDELGSFNVLCEQVLYYGMATRESLPVTCLLAGGELPPPHHLWRIRQMIREQGYLHPVSSYKKHPLICQFITEKLRTLYPQYYYRLYHIARDGMLHR